MNEQLNMYDYAEPNYVGVRDEILRLHEERKLENALQLVDCCGKKPLPMFRSCNDYFIRCPECGKHTTTKHRLYQAMQAWNKGEVEP
jgi:hypothetical protein